MSPCLSVTHSCLLSFFISFDVFRSCVCNVSGWGKIRALQMAFLCVAVFGTCFIGSDLEDIARLIKISAIVHKYHKSVYKAKQVNGNEIRASLFSRK